MLLRWSAERGIPFAASLDEGPSASSSSSSSSIAAAVASVPTWALGPASRDALDGAFSRSAGAGARTLAARAGASFAWPAAEEGGAVKASEVLLLRASGASPSTVREQ